MGGHGHGESYEIPDYRIYKVADVPKLLQVQKALASHGLKDPWLRNEVWRYNFKEFGNDSSRLRSMNKGILYGVIAAAVTVVGTAIYDKLYPSDHGDSHTHH